MVFLSLLLLSLLLLAPFAMPAQAQENASVAVVTAWALNVRAGPAIAYRIVGAVYGGDRLTVVEQRDGWVKIELNGQEAWVSGWYVNIETVTVPTTEPTATTPPPTATTPPPTATTPPPTATTPPPTATTPPPTATPTPAPEEASPAPTVEAEPSVPVPEEASPAPTVEPEPSAPAPEEASQADSPATSSPATPSTASVPSSGVGGKIAFATFPESMIYTVNADGSNLQSLTTGVGPDWNPTGDRLAFVDWRETFAAYVINADGSGREQIHEWAAGVREPNWSPDGQQIVFSVQEGGHLKEHEQCFAGGAFCIAMPPDPKWRMRRIEIPSRDVFEISSFRRSLSPGWLSNTEVLFAGDGRLHKVGLHGDDHPQEIYDRGPFVDPRYCALTGQVASTYRQHDHWEVYSIHVSGTGLKRLTGRESVLGPSTGNNIMGAWSPDCSQLIFFSDRDGRWQPYIVNADGSNKQLFLAELFEQFTFEFDYGFTNHKLIDWTE